MGFGKKHCLFLRWQRYDNELNDWKIVKSVNFVAPILYQLFSYWILLLKKRKRERNILSSLIINIHGQR